MSDKDPSWTDETAVANHRQGQPSRFRFVRSLGSGGMGDVHLAEDSALRRQVAIKSIRVELCKDNEVLKRIERECLLHAKIGSHPHIVTLYDRLEEEGRINLVMEYVEGETLHNLIDRLSKEGKRLSLKDGIAIAVQTLEALARIHAHSIVHRDIKPANIMITRDDCGEYCAKLMDFGIARADDDGMTALTQDGTGGPGTPLYMAPEQIDPKTYGEISPATDVYAMGIMLYQIVSGKPPFTGTLTEIFNGHLTAAPERLDAKADPQVPQALADIIDRALSKRPSDRYPSAHAFREVLLNVGEASAVASGLPSSPSTPDSARTVSASEMASSTALGRGQTMLGTGGGARKGTGTSGAKIAAIIGVVLIGMAAVTGGVGYFAYTKFFAGGTNDPVAEDTTAVTDSTAPEPGDVAAGAPPSTPAEPSVPDATIPTGAIDPTNTAIPAGSVDMGNVPNATGAVTPPPTPTSTPPIAPDTSAVPASSFTNDTGTGSRSNDDTGGSAVSLFEQLRSKNQSESPDTSAGSTPASTTGAPAQPAPEPPDTSANQTSTPEPPAAQTPDPAPKAKPKPKPKPEPAPEPAKEPEPEPEPQKPASGGFSVISKEATRK